MIIEGILEFRIVRWYRDCFCYKFWDVLGRVVRLIVRRVLEM